MLWFCRKFRGKLTVGTKFANFFWEKATFNLKRKKAIVILGFSFNLQIVESNLCFNIECLRKWGQSFCTIKVDEECPKNDRKYLERWDFVSSNDINSVMKFVSSLCASLKLLEY